MAEENQEKQQTDSKKQTDSIEAQEKHLLDSKETLIKQLGEMIKSDTLDLKDKKSARSQRDKLIKGSNTLGSDLKKNVQDLKDGVTTTVDGFINETFGPIGGMVSSLTTGFFKRGKQEKDAKDLQVLELETAQDMYKEFKDGGTKDTLEKTAESAEETSDNTKDSSDSLKTLAGSAEGIETAMESIDDLSLIHI